MAPFLLFLYSCILRLKNKKVDLLKYLLKVVHKPSKVPTEHKSNVWPDKIRSPPIITYFSCKIIVLNIGDDNKIIHNKSCPILWMIDNSNFDGISLATMSPNTNSYTM